MWTVSLVALESQYVGISLCVKASQKVPTKLVADPNANSCILDVYRMQDIQMQNIIPSLVKWGICCQLKH